MTNAFEASRDARVNTGSSQFSARAESASDAQAARVATASQDRSPQGAATSTVAATASAATYAQPLSEATVASRSALSNERPPVIQIAIERIDVRAPVASSPKKPARAERPSAPTRSLTDYLSNGKASGAQR